MSRSRNRDPDQPERKGSCQHLFEHVCLLVRRLRCHGTSGSDGGSPSAFWPVVGSRKSLFGPPSSAAPSKENRFKREPALVSKEKFPMRPVCQLSSMKRRIEL